jgi:hypothetical protein
MNAATGILDSTETVVNNFRTLRHYTQYTNHKDNFRERFGLDYVASGQNFLFQESRNRNSSNVVTITNAVYEHDSKGRLVKEMLTTGSSIKVNMYEYYN